MIAWSILAVGMLAVPFVAVATSSMVTKWIEFKRFQIAAKEISEKGELARQAGHIELLSRRVATLEAIVTDPSLQLARSIDALPPASYREH